MRAFHIYLGRYPSNALHTCAEVLDAIKKDTPIIHTTQLFEVTSTLIVGHNYRIFVHPLVGDTFELTMGDCPHTAREIRPSHNLAKLLYAGEFDHDGVICVKQ